MPAPSASNETIGRCRGSEAVTRGVRVRVSPFYLPEQSDPSEKRWVFGYRITLRNENEAPGEPVRLHARHWIVVDANGERHEVKGEGVVGHQPALAPGETFEYASYCPLPTPWGTMEGVYKFRAGAGGGEEFDARVARFYFVAPEDE